jgi:hypothetical protein
LNSNTNQESTLDNLNSQPLTDPVVAEAIKMREEVIDKLGHNYDQLVEGNKPYLETRRKIVDDYASGKKDAVTLRSFSYLSSLEGKWDEYQKASQEFCKNKDLCKKATTRVSLSGVIADEQGKPIKGAKISVYGESTSAVVSGVDGKYSLSFDTL